MESSSENSRIAKNTLYLYTRMFITMSVGLYTSRVVLQTLGIDDYGLYNIIGGIIVLFSFVSNSLKNATQRYLSYEIGRNTKGNVHKVFSVSIQCHIVISVALLLLAETIGLWFCMTQLNVPIGREDVVNYVYQFSVLTFIIQVIQIPFYSAIISFEKMSFYAYISILEVILKLVLVYVLLISPCDKLILYSILICIVSIVILFANIYYCVCKLGLRPIKFMNDRVLFKKLLNFSGWSMTNGCAVLLSHQCGNYFMNIFIGVTANAAFGIANQVSGIIYSFVTNFQSAFQPRIVKLYASREYESLKQLIFRTSLLSYYLLFLIAIIFSVKADFILEQWLGVVPEYTSIFCILLLCYFLIDAMQAPIWMLIYGTGKIKEYTIVTAVFAIINIPIAWLLLFNHMPLYSIFISRIILNICCCVYRMIYVKINLNFPSLKYFKEVCLRALFVTFITIFFIEMFMYNTQFNSIIQMLLSFICTCLFILVIGFSPSDRKVIIKIIKERVIKR